MRVSCDICADDQFYNRFFGVYHAQNEKINDHVFYKNEAYGIWYSNCGGCNWQIGYEYNKDKMLSNIQLRSSWTGRTQCPNDIVIDDYNYNDYNEYIDYNEDEMACDTPCWYYFGEGDPIKLPQNGRGLKIECI